MPYLVCACGILVVFILFLLSPSRAKPNAKAPFMHRNFAHRGLYAKDQSIPENSIAAFSAAKEKGYGVELDIQFSADKQIVVFHDDNLKRMCGCDKRVDELSYAELCELSLKNTEYKIPLFSEVLELAGGEIPLIIELKSGKDNNLLCAEAMKLLDGYSGAYCVESFNPMIVRWFKKNRRDVLRGQLSASPKSFKNIGRFSAFCLGHLFCNVVSRPNFIAYSKNKTSPFAKLAEGMGAMTVVWTVRPDDNITYMQEANDAVIFEYYTPNTSYR